jgi:nitroreductase
LTTALPAPIDRDQTHIQETILSTQAPSTDSRFATFAEVVRSRHSIRSFRPDPVPPATLEAILAVAQCAPSNCNTQPWLTYVVSGERRDRLAQALLAAATANRMTMDFPYDGKYPGVYKERQYDAAARLYDAQNIPREEKERRRQAFLRNYDFFGAPHALFLCVPDWCGPREIGDVGMYAQTLMLAFAAHGIGSCPQTALGMFADVVREYLELPAEQKVLLGISFGYADDSLANTARIPRAELDANVRFLT